MSIQKETQSDRVNNSGSEFSDHVRFEPASQPSRSVVIYYYVTDSLGTPWRMVDASGTVVWAATYSAFGEATTDPALTTVDQPLRMPGQYFDQESGLHYNLARYYDPSIGRYLTIDPLRDAEDYAYALNNPLKYSDPTGEFTFRIPLDPTRFGRWAGKTIESADDITELLDFLSHQTGPFEAACGAVAGGASSKAFQLALEAAGFAPQGRLANIVAKTLPAVFGIVGGTAAGNIGGKIDEYFGLRPMSSEEIRDFEQHLRREYEHQLIEDFRKEFPRAEARITKLNAEITKQR